jgi:uncharacterized membrane protein (TIGR02234 family)
VSAVGAARRELTLAVLGSAAAGALALIAGGQAWARVVVARPAPLPPIDATLSGGEAVPLVPAAGLVLLAAAVALLAVRGVLRAAIGLLIAVAGGVLAWSVFRALTGGLDAAAADLDIGGGGVTTEVPGAWPVVAAAMAAALAVGAGGLVVLRGRSWPGMGRRYERTGAEAPSSTARTDEDLAQDAAQEAWKALDRGEDPTDPEPAPRRARPA